MSTWLLMLSSWIAVDAGWWYFADRRLRNLRLAVIWRTALGAYMACQVFYMVFLLAHAVIDNLPAIFPMFWEVAAYVWHLVVLPTAVAMIVVAKVARGMFRLTRKRNAIDGKAESATNVATAGDDVRRQMSRREAIGAFAAIVPPLAACTLTGRAVVELSHFRVSHRELFLPDLPPDLDGLSIAHVTDLHIGRFLPRGMISRVADATNALAADLVVFTGDLNDLSAKDTRQGVEFMRMLDPRHGLVMIEGNHDVMFDADRFEDPIRDAGLPLLLDSACTFRVPGRATPVQMLGISWGELKSGAQIGRSGKDALRRFRMNSTEATNASIGRVILHRQADAFPILLAHHPHAFDPAAAAGLPLVLSGHTHGGQIMLTDHIGAGPMRFKYWTGSYRKDRSNLFIANGVGNWFPLRLNAPAEIVRLVLRKV